MCVLASAQCRVGCLFKPLTPSPPRPAPCPCSVQEHVPERAGRNHHRGRAAALRLVSEVCVLPWLRCTGSEVLLN